MKNRIKECWPYAVVILAIVLPWFFKSGYLFFTDNVWGPNIELDWAKSAFLFNLFIKGLSFVLPMDFLEKIFVSVVLTLILLGGRHLVKTVLEYDSNVANFKYFNGLVFVLSLFALFNPFVYDRALYGQFGVLAAYGFLLLSATYLFSLWQRLDVRDLLRAAVFSGLAILFSTHFLFLLAPFYLFCLIGLVAKRRELKQLRIFGKFLRTALISLFIIFAFNANWLIANISGAATTVNFVQNVISLQDAEAFRTAGGTTAKVVSNVLLMGGFWGEDQHRYLNLTQVPGWWIGFVLLAPIIILGICANFRRRPRPEKWLSAGLLVIYGLVILLAIGIAAPVAREFTIFLYDYLPLYKGLREPQKWVAVIIPIYLFFLTLGVARLAKVKVVASNHWVAGSVLAVIIIMQAPSLLWGFNRQVRPTPYPADWYAVNELLLNRSVSSDECSDHILFLPWHLYMSFNWVGKIISSPAPVFFSCPTLSGTNMEWGGIYDNTRDPDATAVVAWLTTQGKVGQPNLNGTSVRYMILAKEQDFVSYLWLNDLAYIRPLLETKTLLVYEIKPE